MIRVNFSNFCSIMFYIKVPLVLLLLGNLPESVCRKEHSSEWQFDYRTEDTKLWSTEVTLGEDSKDDSHLLFPIDIFTMGENRQEPGGREVRKAGTFTNRSKDFMRKLSGSFSSGGSQSRLGSSRSASDLKPLLECMFKIVKVSLPPVVLGEASDPITNFLGIIDDFSGEVTAAHLVAIAIDHDKVETFIDAATSCFEFFKQDSDGQLVLDGDFATSAAAESIKLHPMGALAVGVTEAVADNVRVTYDGRNKPLYIVKYTGLFTGLGLAAVKTTKVGQIAVKSTEGRSWLSRSVIGTIEHGYNHTPLRQIALMECVLNAATSALSVTAPHDQGFSTLELFIKASTPCFGLFSQNENGNLKLDEAFAAEAINFHPLGMLAVGSAKAIVESVSAARDGYGIIQYNIDYSALATGLGNAVVESAEIGNIAIAPPGRRRRKQNVVSRFIWGPDSSFSDRMPAGLVKALKITRECVVRYWESAWYTRVMSDLVRGVGPHNRIPVNLSQLLGCVAKAIGSSLYGAVFRERSRRAPQSAENPESIVTNNVLESFVSKVKPCFGFFTINEHGMLELDPAFLRGIVAEAIRTFPVGSVIAGTVESIAENVTRKRNKEGQLRFKINYPGLAIGLGMTAIGVTTFGIGGYAASLVISFF